MPELKISYPAALPISQRKDEIAAAIRDNQVIIVAGETGSGKTTQLPKICLEIGRGVASRAGWRHGRSPSGSPRSSAPRLARRSATRCGSPTNRATARLSR